MVENAADSTYIHITTAENQYDLPAVYRNLTAQQSGERSGPGPLDDDLRPLDQQDDRPQDVLVSNGHDPVYEFPYDSERQVPRLLHSDSICDRLYGRQFDRPPCL